MSYQPVRIFQHSAFTATTLKQTSSFPHIYMNITASVSNNSILRVVIAPNAPDAFDNCVEFPTFRPSLRCPFPGWCLEVITVDGVIT